MYLSQPTKENKSFTTPCAVSERTVLRILVIVLLGLLVVVSNQDNKVSLAAEHLPRDSKAVGNQDSAYVSRKPPEVPSNDSVVEEVVYQPSSSEAYLMSHLDALGYKTTGLQKAEGCTIWRDQTVYPELSNNLHAFLSELGNYTERLLAFPALSRDLRQNMSDVWDAEEQDRLCRAVELHPEGLPGMFPSGQLSYSNWVGYAEPLFPPMRHPKFCFKETTSEYLMNLDYLLHDFGKLCRRLKKKSRIVLFDMGASLTFHGSQLNSPSLYLPALFRKFGFWFDHIYAFEARASDPSEIYSRVPEELLVSYHWYNVPVQFAKGNRANPFSILKREFTEDDLVLVKLDVDTPSVELPLARQILEDPDLLRLIDHFYFEHHVHLQEIAWAWGGSVDGSVADTLQLFHELRAKGVMSHFWV